MARDDTKQEVLPKDSVTKQELSDEQLASIAGGRAAAPHRAGAASMKKVGDERAKAQQLLE